MIYTVSGPKVLERPPKQLFLSKSGLPAQWAGAWKLPKMESSHSSIYLSILETREKIQFNTKKINSNTQF